MELNKKGIFDEIADKAIDAFNDAGWLDIIYKDYGCDLDNMPEDINNSSIVVISDEDLKKISEQFPDIIIGGYTRRG